MLLLLFLDTPIPFWALSVDSPPAAHVVTAMQILFIAESKSKIVAFPFIPSSVLCKKCLLKRYVLSLIVLYALHQLSESSNTLRHPIVLNRHKEISLQASSLQSGFLAFYTWYNPEILLKGFVTFLPGFG